MAAPAQTCVYRPAELGKDTPSLSLSTDDDFVAPLAAAAAVVWGACLPACLPVCELQQLTHVCAAQAAGGALLELLKVLTTATSTTGSPAAVKDATADLTTATPWPQCTAPPAPKITTRQVVYHRWVES